MAATATNTDRVIGTALGGGQRPRGGNGFHLLGGILTLSYLLLRTTKKCNTVDSELRRVGAAGAAAIYWHFMDGLWVALFLLLFFWK